MLDKIKIFLSLIVFFLFVFLGKHSASGTNSLDQNNIALQKKPTIQQEQNILPYFQNNIGSKDLETQKNTITTNLKTLHFLTTTDFPPFNFIDKNGYLVGYHIDLMRALCQELNLEHSCKIEALPFNELVPHLLSGKGDAIVAGLKPSKDLKGIYFTPAYLRFPGRFITLKENHFAQYDLEKKWPRRIGVLEQTTHEAALENYFPKSKIVAVKEQKILYTLLKERKIDAIFADGLSLSRFLMSEEGEECCSFSDGPYALDHKGLRIAFHKNNIFLGRLLAVALHTLEKKGTLKELYLRYFPIGFY